MVPFSNLKLQARALTSEIDAAVSRAIGSASIGPADEIGVFERRFADYCNVDWCGAVASGTSAIQLALLAAGIGPGDEVITVSMNLVSATAAILRCGARPIFVDVDPVTWTMEPALIEAAITRRTRAILPAHLYGLMTDMDSIMAIAQRHGLLVIEDAAQAHGAEYKGRRAGSSGDLGCFSFYPDKNLGAYGEAGAVVTRQPEFGRRIARLLDGRDRDKRHQVLPACYERMDAVQAAVLNVKMEYIEAWTEARRSIAAEYDQALPHLPFALQRSPHSGRHVYHAYALRLPHRDDRLRIFQQFGIGTRIDYPVPIHLRKEYSELGDGVAGLHATERLASELVAVPIYPELLPDQVVAVSSALKKIAWRNTKMLRGEGGSREKAPKRQGGLTTGEQP